MKKENKLGKRKILNRLVVRRKRMNLIIRNGLRNNVKKIKELEIECDDEKIVRVTVEECDLNLVLMV